MAKVKGNWKQWLKIGAITLMFVFIIGSIITLAVKLDRQTETKRIGTEAYSIGVLNASGEVTEANTSVILEKAITTDGLKCKLADEAKITYQIFFYDEDDKFISATEALSTDYDGSGIPATATRARIMITPTEDEDGKVSIFEKGGYAQQLTVTVNK